MLHFSPRLCVDIQQPAVTWWCRETSGQTGGHSNMWRQGRTSGDIYLLMGLQSTLRPPNRNKALSDAVVSVCHDLPTGAHDTGVLGISIAQCHERHTGRKRMSFKNGTGRSTYISDHVHDSRSRQWMSLVLVSWQRQINDHVFLLSSTSLMLSSHHDSASTDVSSATECGAGVGCSRGRGSALRAKVIRHVFWVTEGSRSTHWRAITYVGLWFAPAGWCGVKHMNLIVPSPENVFYLNATRRVSWQQLRWRTHAISCS